MVATAGILIGLAVDAGIGGALATTGYNTSETVSKADEAKKARERASADASEAERRKRNAEEIARQTKFRNEQRDLKKQRTGVISGKPGTILGSNASLGDLGNVPQAAASTILGGPSSGNYAGGGQEELG